MDVLSRSRLLRRLEVALDSGHVVVTAPAGYGKSLLLRHLAAQRPFTYYLPLQAADTDLTHLQTRLDKIQDVFSRSQSVLMLDDIHYLEAESESLLWLQNRLRDLVPRLLLAGRRMPEAVQALLPGSGIVQIKRNELAFTGDEARALLGKQYPGERALIDQWQAQTGGWPLAMALIARAQAAPDPFAAATTDLFTYLAHWLSRDLPPDIRHYWTITAVPSRFNDDLAAVLLEDSSDPSALRREVQRRNLFLETADVPGWFQYHDLIRDFLRQTSAQELTPVYWKVVRWFEGHGELELAVEHALDGHLEQEAVRLIASVPAQFLWDHCRYLTYRRWILSLSKPTQAANPDLLIRLGSQLVSVAGMEKEGEQYLLEASQLARVGSDVVTEQRARLALIRHRFKQGQNEPALAELEQLLADTAVVGEQRLHALRFASIILCDLARYQRARHIYQEAIALAEREGNPMEAMLNRQNLASGVLIPLGDFAEARRHLNAASDFFASSPGMQLTILTTWCDYYNARGEWKRLDDTVAQMAALFAKMEVVERSDRLWWQFYRAVLAVGQERLSEAQTILAEVEEERTAFPLAEICFAWLTCWLLRRQAQYEQAIQLARTTLARPLPIPFYRALIALEWSLSQLLQAEAPAQALHLHPEVTNLVMWRAKAELMRLRAWLVVCCWRRNDTRWQRHLHALVRTLQSPDYQTTLMKRDPELSAAVWTVALTEGLFTPIAREKLQQLGDPEPVLPLLQHAQASTRLRAAETLAAIGQEEAMPALAEAIAGEKEATVMAALKQALAHLESQPPPSLRVHLMGEFRLWRGDTLVPDDAWYRPIVRRLFYYFAVHRGETIARDRILDDMWPETNPDKAWATFRTVYSRLRHVLEPYMQSKADSRYFSLEGDAYRFDPGNFVWTDIEMMETVVNTVLADAATADVLPLPHSLLQALARWAPLLPELPYEEWLLGARERVDRLYVEGCLYAARALLAHARPSEAVLWAQRAIAQAPWLEEGYRSLMRAHARQGQRGVALKTYEEAVAALAQELGVAPSEQTQWLIERLQRGEAI